LEILDAAIERSLPAHIGDDSEALRDVLYQIGKIRLLGADGSVGFCMR
jgi:hypothetical protein